VLARPFASVVDVDGLTLPPPLVTLHATETPATGARNESITVTVSGVASEALTVAVCWLPLNTETPNDPVGLSGVVPLLELHAVAASTMATRPALDNFMDQLLTVTSFRRTFVLRTSIPPASFPAALRSPLVHIFMPPIAAIAPARAP
jgi:hypothetical protein